jgi:hypothetical protein
MLRVGPAHKEASRGGVNHWRHRDCLFRRALTTCVFSCEVRHRWLTDPPSALVARLIRDTQCNSAGSSFLLPPASLVYFVFPGIVFDGYVVESFI